MPKLLVIEDDREINHLILNIWRKPAMRCYQHQMDWKGCRC